MKSFSQTILFIFLCSPIITIAQTDNFDKINFGVTYGMSYNDVFNHEFSTYDFKAQFSPLLFTVFAEKQIHYDWIIGAELEYIHKGPEDYNIDYLTLSILPKHRIVEGGNFSIVCGAYVGYLFEYKIRGQIVHAPQLKQYDLGIDAGLDFYLPINDKLSWVISPRVEVGVIRFSYSNHLSFQLKTGLSF